MIKKRFVFVVFSLLIISQPLLAHSPINGIGNFYNGFLHPFFIPSHIMLILANAVFLGQYGVKNIQTPLYFFVFSTMFGLIFSLFSSDIKIETFILFLSTIIGLIVALNYKKSILLYIMLSLLSGFMLGIDSTQEKLILRDKIIALIGSFISIALLFSSVIVLSDYLNKKKWQQIAIRIFGSWIGAISIMVLALSLKIK